MEGLGEKEHEHGPALARPPLCGTSPHAGASPCVGESPPHAGASPPTQAGAITSMLQDWVSTHSGSKTAPHGLPFAALSSRKGKLRHEARDQPRSALLTLMEAPANRASCLMCCPFFPMMAPTACVGMNKFTTSCSGSWRGHGRARRSGGDQPDRGVVAPPPPASQGSGCPLRPWLPRCRSEDLMEKGAGALTGC